MADSTQELQILLKAQNLTQAAFDGAELNHARDALERNGLLWRRARTRPVERLHRVEDATNGGSIC